MKNRLVIIIAAALAAALFIQGCRAANVAESTAETGAASESSDAVHTDSACEKETEAENPSEGAGPLIVTSSDGTEYSLSDRYMVYGWTDNPDVLDIDGNYLGTKDDVAVITDVLTGKTAYYSTRRMVRLPEREDGSADGKSEFDLYSLSGERLADYSEYTYYQALGDLVIKQEYVTWYMIDETGDDHARSALINARSGEVVVQDAYLLTKFDDESAMVLDFDGLLMGIIDSGGSFTKVPSDKKIYYPSVTSCGMLIGSCGERRCIFDRNLNLVFEAPEGTDVYTYDSCFNCVSYGIYRGEKTLVDMTTGEEVFACVCDNFVYYDGEVAAVAGLNFDYQYPYYLLDAETGEPIAGPYDSIIPIKDERGYADRFFAYNDDGIYVIGRDGAKLAKRPPLQDITSTVINSGRIACNYWPGDEMHAAIYDEKLNEINIFPGCNQIDSITDENGQHTGLFKAAYYNGLINPRYAIVDAGGKILIDGISFIGTCMNERIAIRRGTDIGLIDYAGKWIAKTSIYSVMGGND